MSLSSYFLHTVKWFQVFLCNSHYLTSVICLHTVNSIRPIDRILLCATMLGQSGPGRNSNEGELYIPQILRAGASPSDGLMSYPGHSCVCGGGYLFAEMLSVYSTAPANWGWRRKSWIHTLFVLCEIQTASFRI